MNDIFIIKLQVEENPSKSKVFGVALENVPSTNIGDDCYCPIPKYVQGSVLINKQSFVSINFKPYAV